MCGIVGLFAKEAGIERELGAHLATMLASLSDRGPDSAGFAVYAPAVPGAVKLTLRAPEGFDFFELAARLAPHVQGEIGVTPRGTHAVLTVPAGQQDRARAALGELAPEVVVVGAGERMELYKEVGRPERVVRQFHLQDMAGSHGIGHTRMATESAVTTDGAHPYSTGPDQCLVHNGSLSNHNAVRRELRRLGYAFATENDTEVAAAYLSARMAEGAGLDAALRQSMLDLTGFLPSSSARIPVSPCCATRSPASPR
jgi:glutamate synthase domain-containing protein 1